MNKVEKFRLAIVSTTIRGDKGYRDWDEAGKKSEDFDVSFHIAGDLNSVDFDSTGFRNTTTYFTPSQQNMFECSAAIGWRRWARRNIALLDALKTNPDYVLFIDDDNRPAEDYFPKWAQILRNTVTSSLATNTEWFNYLDSAISSTTNEINFFPRGFPIQIRREVEKVSLSQTLDNPRDIFLFQGISYGDPDIDAFARISNPEPMPVKAVRIINYTVRNKWSPYNSQNTLFHKSLAPLAFTWPNAGRYEDIYASFLWQHYTFSQGKLIHIGDSVNVQERGIRNDHRDLVLELEGYEKSLEVRNAIQRIDATDIESTINGLIRSEHPIIARERQFFETYYRDLQRISIK